MPASLPRPVPASRNLPAVLHALAGNPAAGREVLVRLAAARTDRTGLARRPGLPAEAAAILARDDDVHLRRSLAARPDLPAEVQTVLARDTDAGVRGQLAEGASFFTTVGVHGLLSPKPLPYEVYALPARDPEPKVRRAPAFNRHVPDDIRAGMLDDGNARTAAVTATEWNPAPVARIGDLLSRLPRDVDRERLLSHLDGPLPARTARALLAEADTSAAPAVRTDLRAGIAAVADLDAELTDRFLTDPTTRAGVAANPSLDPARLPALARDPDNEVRAAVVARRGLDPELRESVPVEYDDASSGNAIGRLLTEELSASDQIALARSRHQAFRLTLTLRSDLTDETVEILARDESFAVRLFVCEHQANAPGRLLAEIAADWKSYSRWDMLAHKGFPAGAATALALSEDPADRAVAAAHPGLPAATVEALVADGSDAVRRRAASNPSLPADRLLALLGAEDQALASGAAANLALPVETMGRILGRAGL